MTHLDALFFLRGRPGLGHVIPGLAIARELAALGARVGIATYDNGLRFFARGGAEAAGVHAILPVDIRPAYEDWPGLDQYDHGTGAVAELVQRTGARLLVFGGEYVMGPVGRVLGCRSAMLFNPEILDDSEKNRIPTALLCRLFDDCDWLIPLDDQDDAAGRARPGWRPRLLQPGPFVVRAPGCPQQGRRFVVANGGGVSFPAQTRSYSSSSVDPRDWVRQTERMTSAAAELLAARLGPHDCLDVFSSLGDDWNARLAERLADHAVTVSPPGLDYYDALAVADLLVSRAGNGVLADLANTGACGVVWTLAGHDEQLSNARRAKGGRPRTWVSRTEEELALHLGEALRALDQPRPAVPSLHDARRNAAIVAGQLYRALAGDQGPN